MPDKQEDDLKKEAQDQFYLISMAYNVLKNERTRAIYDKFGSDGLNLLLELQSFDDTVKLEDIEKKLEHSGISGSTKDKFILPSGNLTYSFTPNLVKLIFYLFSIDEKDTNEENNVSYDQHHNEEEVIYLPGEEEEYNNEELQEEMEEEGEQLVDLSISNEVCFN